MPAFQLDPTDDKILTAHAQLTGALELLDECGLLRAAACLSATLDVIHRDFPQLSSSH
jgi:hypothetical protein